VRQDLVQGDRAVAELRGDRGHGGLQTDDAVVREGDGRRGGQRLGDRGHLKQSRGGHVRASGAHGAEPRGPHLAPTQHGQCSAGHAVGRKGLLELRPERGEPSVEVRAVGRCLACAGVLRGSLGRRRTRVRRCCVGVGGRRARAGLSVGRGAVATIARTGVGQPVRARSARLGPGAERQDRKHTTHSRKPGGVAHGSKSPGWATRQANDVLAVDHASRGLSGLRRRREGSRGSRAGIRSIPGRDPRPGHAGPRRAPGHAPADTRSSPECRFDSTPGPRHRCAGPPCSPSMHPEHAALFVALSMAIWAVEPRPTGLSRGESADAWIWLRLRRSRPIRLRRRRGRARD
jgi:hypothetical protein